MTPDRIRVRMARLEGAQLKSLVEDLRQLLGSERDVTDPALSRLAPDAYPDDAEASRDFASATRDDLLDRRALDADIVHATLADFTADPAALKPSEAFTERDIALSAEDLEAWLRTLTALRLVIADRLIIEDDDDHDPEDQRFGVYDWLGYRLELLVQAADERL